MTRRLLSLLALTAMFLLAAAPAGAQTPDQVAARVGDSGYWIDSGLPAAAQEDRISAAVSRAGNAGVRLFVVLLENDPPGGATTFADAILDRIGDGTVLVLSEGGEGMASFIFDQAMLERAMDAGYGAGGGDVGYVDAVVATLTGAPVTPGAGDGEAGGGSKTGLIVMLALIGGLVLLVVWAVRRQSKSAAQSKARAIEEARREIKLQLDAMANTILEISDKVSASPSREDNEYLERASRTFTEASDGYEGAADLARLAEISDRIDEARWELDAAAALADDKPVPPKPVKEERSACFFDPTHGGPFEDAEVRTAAGTTTVRVCAADAEKLRRGQQPQPRLIQVGGRDVPAAAAPRSYGGGGFDWLEVFAVIVGGMGQSRSYDWSRRSSGGWGSGGWGGSSGSGRTSSSSGSTRARARTSSGGGTSRARAGRTRTRGR